MQCQQVTERLSAYLDGELSAEVEASVREHLAACPRCAEEFEELKRTGALLDSVPSPTLSAGFARRVREAAEGGVREAPRPFGRALMRVAATLLAAAGLALGMAIGGQMNGTATASPETTAETDIFDLQADALSPAPAGSVPQVYLASMEEAGQGGEVE